VIIDIYNTTNQYEIIYADPPWKYGGSGGTKWSPASEYYQTMSFDELKGLPVKQISNPASCLLFMWIPAPIIPQGIELAETWGFKYITCGFVWYKKRANVGNYTMSGCEQLFIFKRGKIPADRVRNPGTIQWYESSESEVHIESITRHSAKPPEFAKRIKQMFPKSKCIELFSRQERIGWDHFGNEILPAPKMTEMNELLH